MAIEYPPYVTGYGGIPTLFRKIKEATVPAKFTQDFLTTVLDLKSSSFRPMIPLLKKLGFIDPANVPTQAYREVREDDRRGEVMAQRIRDAYRVLFNANEFAYKLDKKDLIAKLKGVLGAGEDDGNVPCVAATFMELSKLAKWDGKPSKTKDDPPPDEHEDKDKGGGDGLSFKGRLGLSYTINLNLPATTDIDVFNAIFKSLRENLLRQQ